MLQSLIYVSKAVRPMASTDLLQLLVKAKASNDILRITGMLLYIEGKFLNTIEGRFIQVIEGRQQDINVTFNKIKTDPRHTNVSMLNLSTISKRNFKDWSMGFKSIQLNDFKQALGYFDLDDTDHLKSNPKSFNVPMMYLKSFYAMRPSA
jgi:hypothetical protein